jgi:hypothetical protein
VSATSASPVSEDASPEAIEPLVEQSRPRKARKAKRRKLGKTETAGIIRAFLDAGEPVPVIKLTAAGDLFVIPARASEIANSVDSHINPWDEVLTSKDDVP